MTTLVGALLVAVALVVGAGVMLLTLHRADDRTMYQATGEHAYELAEFIESGGVGSIPDADLRPGASGVDMVQIVDFAGRVVRRSPDAPAAPVVDSVPAPGESTQFDTVRVNGREREYCGTATGVTYDGRRYTVVTLVSAEPYRSGLANTATLLAIGLPILVALAAAAIYYFVGRALRPVGRITQEVTAITASDLSRRVPVPAADDEISLLASTMNDMLSRLDHSRDAQLRFVGDASHELRSPLTSIVGILDLADDTDSHVDLDTVRSILLPEAQRMQHMVTDLLLLARADENGMPLKSTDIDLDDLVAAEVHRLRSLGVARVRAQVAPVRVHGDREKLTRALRNLVDNAVRYATSTVLIDASRDPAGQTAVIRVADDGPGIPMSMRQNVFDRFTRLDVDRRNAGGSGLGLAIVYEIARAHGGSVTATGAPAGFDHGVTFVLTLPMTDPAPLDTAPTAPGPIAGDRLDV
ncbi:ATP-binding protein [Gordonia sinesedis]